MLKFHDGKTKCVCYLLDCSNHKPLSLVKIMNRLEKILPETIHLDHSGFIKLSQRKYKYTLHIIHSLN